VTTIIPTIRYELLGPPIWASTGASDPDGIQRLPGQLHLCAVRTVQVATEWQAVAVHDEPPLRPLALPGQAHLLAALLGGHERAIQEGNGPVEFALPMKAASAARQMRSQTPSSPQRLSRRHTVVGAPYSRGRSCHRQPAVSTYRMPSQVRRSLARG